MPVYLDYDQEALDNQYSQIFWVPDMEKYTSVTHRLSDEARGTLEMAADISYGDSAAEILDIFPTTNPGAPVRVFFHGGAWLKNTKENAAYAARLHVEAGAVFVAVNFAKADQAALGEIVRQARAATAWVWRNIADYGGDADRIYVGGHSSGAHLGGNVVTTDWADFEAPEDLVKGAVLVSGMYDMEPVRLSARNDYLHLDEAQARSVSALHNIPARGFPVVIGHTEFDSDEFRHQSKAFADAWAAKGRPCTYLPVAGKNHFSVAPDLGDPESDLGRATLDQMGIL